MKCSNCGAEIYEGFRYCNYCGTYVETGTPKEENTTVQHIHVHNHYYGSQGDASTESNSSTRNGVSTRNRLILTALFFTLGAVGAHKFYSGRIGMGILYALTGGLFGIGLFFDFFSILFGTPKDNLGLPICW